MRWLVILALLVLPGTGQARDTVGEVLEILKDEGIIDAATEQKLLVQHEAEQERRSAPPVAAALTDGWEWEGDLRLRYETLWYHRDEAGTERDNRYRARYRARLGVKRQLNDRVKVGFRLATGVDNLRGTNQTLGNTGVDFDPDGIAFDRAYAELSPPPIAGIRTKLTGGKFANPFRWKYGKDQLVWDPDITLEGAALATHFPVGEGRELWLTTGAFIAEERSTNADPKLVALQLGGTTRISDSVQLGARASLFEWRSLSPRFIMRSAGLGNLTSAFDGKARIGETSAFLSLSQSDAWPILLYGSFARNFSADSTLVLGVPAGDEDTAFGGGIEIGSSSQWIKLGFGYFQAEANSVIATFMDSDILDGHTNRKGFVLYGAKKVYDHTELRLTLFDSKELEDAPIFGPAFGFDSVTDSDRRRMQADVIFSF